MGKVGSSSVYQSLLDQYAGAVLHTHGFNAKRKDLCLRRLYRWTLEDGRPLNVISLVREPIGRNVSAFFQNFRRDAGVHYADSHLSVPELRSLFLTNYEHDIPLEWFDKTILPTFGIDVFASPFPESGTSTYSRNNIRLLVMRVELNDEEKAKAIGDFLGMSDVRLRNANISDSKEYAAMYAAFRDGVKLPPEYISKMCDSKYFKHFYSREVIEATRRKWSRV